MVRPVLAQSLGFVDLDQGVFAIVPILPDFHLPRQIADVMKHSFSYMYAKPVGLRPYE